MEPFFSVVIAAFNAERWIVPTIRSALDQTFRDFEIVVIGDGCTDRTGETLTSTFGEAIRWKNLERNNGGQSFPNNEGIRLSRGTHIAYLGHDDIWSRHHLERLAGVVRRVNPDFAVSGAVYHGPPGSRYYQLTGLFDDPAVAAEEFFPPSSFAHRRDVVERIGPWRDPAQLSAPADCEFLLRAVEQQCSFASTNTLTVHKFAAGHRYLSYRFPSAEEQSCILGRLGSDGEEARLLEEIQQDIRDGAHSPPIRYVDFGRFAAGDLYRRNRRVKGLEKTPPTLIDRATWMSVARFPAGLDWYKRERHPVLGPFRWSGPNPNPRYLLNVRPPGNVELRIHVLAFADEALGASLGLEVNDRPFALARGRDARGVHIFTVGPVPGPADDGLVLRFRLPRCALLREGPVARRAGFALSGVEVIPLP